MLVRDVLPLMPCSQVVIYDKLDEKLYRGSTRNVLECPGLLTLNVVSLDYHLYPNEFVMLVDNRDGDFHEIELLLSDCLRYADGGCMVNYVEIMHLALRVAQIAETNFARMMGR